MSNGNITPYQWSKFFKLLSEAHSVRNACIKAKISRASAYNNRNADPSIRDRWLQAETEAAEYLEDVARNRAVDGVVKETAIFWKGEHIATNIETKYSDGLLLALLGARDPRYRKDNLDSKVIVELHKALDRLQHNLTSEEYDKVLAILSSDDTLIDVTATDSETAPRQLGTGDDLSADV